MKSYNKLIAAAVILFAALLAVSNAAMLSVSDTSDRYRLFTVEVERLCTDIENGIAPDLSECSYVSAVAADDGSSGFYETRGTSAYRRIGGTVYRFDYTAGRATLRHRLIVMNIAMLCAFLLTLAVLIYIRRRIIKPFIQMSDLPYELSRGNLTVPLKEERSRYFGKFIWGTDMLREKLEAQRQAELALQKEKQTLLLSISHDIKTPLAAIALYSKALSKGLYTEPEKLAEVYESIGGRATEIEQFVSSLTKSASEEFLRLEVNMGECYLSEIVESIERYYSDKLGITHTQLTVTDYSDCLLSCDRDRAVEVLQNVMENAVKYGDGSVIELSFSDEEDCRLITVTNSGCTLPDAEVPHIFDSFWRGSNVGSKPGSGLGLYICRSLMMKMDGDIFAHPSNGYMRMTAVFRKA